VSLKPYPRKDYRVPTNRSRWHFCVKPWVEQCADFHNQARGAWEMCSYGGWGTEEGERERIKRVAWYERQRGRAR
jgi:hypothetical protein